MGTRSHNEYSKRNTNDSVRYEYNENGLISAITYLKPNNTDQAWEITSRKRFEYTDGLVTQVAIQSQTNLPGGIADTRIRNFNYDENDVRTDSESSIWDGYNWHVVDRVTNTYSESGKLLKAFIEKPVDRKWITDSEAVYAYNEQDRKTLKKIRTFHNGKWKVLNQEVYSFDKDGNQLSYLKTNDYGSSEEKLYQYDENGLLKNYTYQVSQDQKMISSETGQFINSNGRRYEFLLSKTENGKTNEYKSRYHYNASDLIVLKTTKIKKDGTWHPYLEKYWTYDEDKNIIEHGTRDDKGELRKWKKYYWKRSPEVVHGSNEGSTFKVYPNPTDGMISLQTKNFDNSRYQILDLNGELWQRGNLSESGQIDLRDLPAGMYIFILENISKRKSQIIFKR